MLLDLWPLFRGCKYINYFGINWRGVFLLGALIAVIGTMARTRLRETAEFSDMKRRLQIAVEATRREGLAQAAKHK